MPLKSPMTLPALQTWLISYLGSRVEREEATQRMVFTRPEGRVGPEIGDAVALLDRAPDVGRIGPHDLCDGPVQRVQAAKGDEERGTDG